MSANFPFKIETLLEQCGGNKDIGGIILDEFLIQVEADLKELETCVAGGDLMQAGKVGHRLKGTAGVLGATNLFALCADMEHAGKDGKGDEVVAILPKLKAETEVCVAAVPEAKNML